MKSSETSRSSRASRTRSITRKSRQSLTQSKDDPLLEPVRARWRDILEEEGVTAPVNITRIMQPAKYNLSLEVPKQPTVKVLMLEEESPTELQVEGEVAEREVFKAICCLISSYTSITVLRLIDCRLKAEAVVLIGGCLTETPTVKELYLDLNPIDGEDFSPLLANSTLEVLSLRGCDISGRGAQLISDQLGRHHVRLRVLNLNTNLIDDNGAIALSRGVKWNGRLVCLSLAGNRVGSAGADSLISALMEFTLDLHDLERRKNKLYERATLILTIVKERQENYLANLPPMPPLPSADLQSRKSKRMDTSLRSKKRSDTKVGSKSQRLLTSSSKMTSNGEKTKSVVGRRDRGRASEQTSQISRSRASMKPPKSSLTAISEFVGGDGLMKTDHEADADTLDQSDDDSLSDFSRFDGMTGEEWDRKDNRRRYEEKMLRRLVEDVAAELMTDPAFQETTLTRVFFNSLTNQLCSRGNLTLSHLNLSYNKIREDIISNLNSLISYQERMSMEAGAKRGIKVLMLEGNRIPQEKLSPLDVYFRPSLVRSSSTQMPS